MKIGVFYQSGYKLVACYMALYQLRKIYPNIPIALYEDGSDILKDTAKEFDCNYKKTTVIGLNERYSGRPVKDLSSNIAWLERIYESCTSTLSDVDFIVHYEDDVICKRVIQNPPKHDISGARGPIYTEQLIDYLFNKFNANNSTRGYWSDAGSLVSYGACGGAIFNRLKFIESFDRIKEIDWHYISTLDTRPCEWSDASLSFIMQHAGFSFGPWKDWTQYETKGLGNYWDKTGWSTPLLETPQAAFIHLYKHFYNYSNDELDLAKDYYNKNLLQYFIT